MGDIRRKHSYLFFLVPAIVLTVLYIDIPSELEWNILLFLVIMVIFDQVNHKVFSGFGYSFITVMISLIIFDRFSVTYGILYLLIDLLIAILFQKRGSLQSMITLFSVYMIAIITCNELYNQHFDKVYYARYLTLVLLLLISMVSKYVYVFLETGSVTTKLFLDRFGPMMFELTIIFPILAFFEEMEVNLVLILFLSYYTFIGFLHKKFMAINQSHIDIFIKRITQKYDVEIYFIDLKGIKGVFHLEKKMIFIDENLDYPEQLQTIIHELLHYLISGRLRFSKTAEEMIITLFEALVSWYYIITLRYNHEID